MFLAAKASINMARIRFFCMKDPLIRPLGNNIEYIELTSMLDTQMLT